MKHKEFMRKQTSLQRAFLMLRDNMEGYCPISEPTWLRLQRVLRYRTLAKGQNLTVAGEIPTCFAFVIKGLMRGYAADEEGREYTKIFFAEGYWPGSMVALLKQQPSQFVIEALEDCEILEVNFKAYRQILEFSEDLKWFHILYLEKNWLIGKDDRDVALVHDSATKRYKRFLQSYKHLESRLTQYHIASHLGITPTHLSRIRRELQGESP